MRVAAESDGVLLYKKNEMVVSDTHSKDPNRKGHIWEAVNRRKYQFTVSCEPVLY